MALQLGELGMHEKLSILDVRANEIYYHNLHFVHFRNKIFYAFLSRDDDNPSRVN